MNSLAWWFLSLVFLAGAAAASSHPKRPIRAIALMTAIYLFTLATFRLKAGV